MNELDGRIAVLGLGKSGEAVVRWAMSRPGTSPSSVVAYAEDNTPELRAIAARLRALGVQVELGVSEIRDTRFDMIVASPGISPTRPLMQSAADIGVPLISELELAWRVSRAPFIAVTGTNGKTTTTALITHLLRAAGRNAQSAGNIGDPAITAARFAVPDDIIVVECSSFQLALTHDFHPRVSVLLNITPDHIDWHGSFEKYAADKARVFTNQGKGDLAVVNVDDVFSEPWANAVAAKGVKVVRVGFVSGAARVEDGVLRTNIGAGNIPLVASSELQIRGSHNVVNALSAASAALLLGADPEVVRQGLRTFKPIEHRLQPVATVRGVEYVNDSKATNPDAVMKALTAFEGRPLIIMLGGKNKGNDFSILARACASACRMAVVYGEAREDLERAFRAAGTPFTGADTMEKALKAAAAAAVQGDTVLLSPACASFDEFSGYEERGRTFAAGVAELARGAR